MSFIKIKFTDTLGDFDKEFQRYVDEMFRLSNTRVTFFQREWRPQVDIYEGDDGIFVLVEIAGVEKDDLSVELQSRILKISGKRELPHTENKKFLLAEIPRGYFERRITFSDPIDVESVKATYINGLLKIWMEKLSPEKARKIPIKKKS